MAKSFGANEETLTVVDTNSKGHVDPARYTIFSEGENNIMGFGSIGNR